MSESNKETVGRDRIIVGRFDPLTSKHTIVTIKGRVDDLTHELVQAINYEEEKNAVLVEKALEASRIKKYLRATVVVDTGNKKPCVKIERAPGYQLFGFLSKVCPKRFVERELSALHADGIEKYLEQLADGDYAGARMTKWAMTGWLIWAVLGGAVSSLLGAFKSKAQSD